MTETDLTATDESPAAPEVIHEYIDPTGHCRPGTVRTAWRNFVRFDLSTEGSWEEIQGEYSAEQYARADLEKVRQWPGVVDAKSVQVFIHVRAETALARRLIESEGN